MPEFRRYRDSNGAEFTQAVSPELAQSKSWKDITDDDHPAVNSDGKPIAAKPADRRPASKANAVKATPATAAQASANDSKGA